MPAVSNPSKIKVLSERHKEVDTRAVFGFATLKSRIMSGEFQFVSQREIKTVLCLDLP